MWSQNTADSVNRDPIKRRALKLTNDLTFWYSCERSVELIQETEGEAVYKRSLVSPVVMFSFVITIVGCQAAIEVKRYS